MARLISTSIDFTDNYSFDVEISQPEEKISFDNEATGKYKRRINVNCDLWMELTEEQFNALLNAMLKAKRMKGAA